MDFAEVHNYSLEASGQGETKNWLRFQVRQQNGQKIPSVLLIHTQG